LFHLKQKKEIKPLAKTEYFFVNVEYAQIKIVIADEEYVKD